MFVFGAGASFDSDPDRPPYDSGRVSGFDYRPPLAAGLFDPDSIEGREAVANFPRAAPLLMRLRRATRQGLDVEEVLEQIAMGEGSYPDTAAQLLSFRAYLARLLAEVPSKWESECQGLTNYVLALEQADRWNKSLHGAAGGPLACVTFNYDSMLEGAVARVFGHQISYMDQYLSSQSVHLYKPHGSVTWRQAATWDHPHNNWLAGHGGLDKAISQAATLGWLPEMRVQTDRTYQDDTDATRVWLPALSIPVRRKATFTMPQEHQDALISDLAKITTVIAIGWRARERHFLQMLQGAMPSAPARLVVVAETPASAEAARDALWETGRFNAYSLSSLGFSGFVDPLPPEEPEPSRTAVRLVDILSGRRDIWTQRTPGRGLTDEPNSAPSTNLPYIEL